MSQGNGHVVIIKIISCPKCVKKYVKNKEGLVGKVKVIVRKDCADGNSGIKETTCPVCRQQIRFRYGINGNAGKLKITIL